MTRRAIVVAPSMPAHDREGGSRDIYDLIGILRTAGWDVVFVAQDGAEEQRYGRELRLRGVRVEVDPSGPSEELLRTVAPHIVVAAFWHVAEELLERVRRVTPDTRVIVSSIDLHFVRQARRIFQAVRKGNRSFLLDGYFADAFAREVNTYAAADAVLTVSEKEAALVDDLTSEAGLAMHVPVTMDASAGRDLPERRGLLFVGNFQHLPNVEAVEWLCGEVLPRLAPATLAAHDVLIVGNAPSDRVREAVAATPGTTLVGWVPDLTPYVETARLSVVPLLHGAGVKGKLVRAMAGGTPVVSTSVGTEGLDLIDGETVLVRDDAAAFAAAIDALAVDDRLWQRLSDAGRNHVQQRHSRELVGRRVLDAVERVLHRAPKPVGLAEQLTWSLPANRYVELRRRVHTVAAKHATAGVPVLVVSKGDDELIEMPNVQAEHFPQDESGNYQGWAPPDGADVVCRLEQQRRRGPHYLLLPDTSLWWLHHYDGLRAYLDEHYELVAQEDDTCLLWRSTVTRQPDVIDLLPRQRTIDLTVTAPPSAGVQVEGTWIARPVVDAPVDVAVGGRVLVVGIYLTDKTTLVDDVVGVLRRSTAYDVEQRWIALGTTPPAGHRRDFCQRHVTERTPKFALVNDVLRELNVADYDFVVVADDDVVLPFGFLEQLLTRQQQFGWSLAQPARTSNSWNDHPIVERQLGVVGRRTRFVEIGPVFSVHRSAYPQVFPFDLTSPMGWGYENVWSRKLADAGLDMGIVDCVAVDHSMRKPVANYSWDEADRQRSALLASTPHTPIEQCMRVLAVEVEGNRPCLP